MVAWSLSNTNCYWSWGSSLTHVLPLSWKGTHSWCYNLPVTNRYRGRSGHNLGVPEFGMAICTECCGSGVMRESGRCCGCRRGGETTLPSRRSLWMGIGSGGKATSLQRRYCLTLSERELKTCRGGSLNQCSHKGVCSLVPSEKTM